MDLYICEKQSLATAVAENLGQYSKRDGYYVVNGDCVAWLRGHVLGLNLPEDYKNPEQDFLNPPQVLPIVPKVWTKKVLVPKNYNIVRQLLKQASTVINVGDPDREGQLLVDEVLEQLQNKLPTKRLFVNAMDSTTVKRALASMEDNADPKNRQMYLSALARQYTDWLIGMNGSRLYRNRTQEKVNIGRVKIPMLALVARRNEQIENFVSVQYYQLRATFQTAKQQEFTALWQIPEDCPKLDEEGRLLDKGIAEACAAKIQGQPGLVTEITQKKGTNSAPLPFSLSTLQRAAGPKLGFSPAKTLEVAQRLYERKLLTYPRSDSNYLPASQFKDAPRILANLQQSGDKELAQWSAGANPSLKSYAYNTKKVSAHHAIIPTLERADLTKLQADEARLYQLVAKRFILQFYPLHKFEQTTATILCAEESFIAKGKVVTQEGWKAIERIPDKNEEEESKELPQLTKGEQVQEQQAEVVEKKTTPPAHFTQDTLIGALTNAYKYVQDPSLKEVIKDIKGIGTEATRSSIMEELIKLGMLQEVKAKKKKELFVSAAVKKLLPLLPTTLTYPDQTALMELDLDKIASGELTLEEYMAKQIAYIQSLVGEPVTCPICGKGTLVKRINSKDQSSFWSCNKYPECKATFSNVADKPLITKCPQCGKGYLRRLHGRSGDFFGCSNYPECKATYEAYKGKPFIYQCPVCHQGRLIMHHNQGGYWAQCNNPACGKGYRVPEEYLGFPDEKK